MCNIIFKKVYLGTNYTVSSKKEANNLKNIDYVIDDYYNNEKTFEQAENNMQKIVANYLIKKDDIDLIIGGDLQNQICATNYMARNYNIPYLGVYSACATFNEALLVGSTLIDSKKIKKCLCITSSHNLVSERQFRYPIEYGAPKLKKSTQTATGAAGCILTNKETNIKVESATIGKVVDLGQSDALNMGSAMAPSAVSTLIEHLSFFNRKPNYYDLILTGDLGDIGTNIFKELLKEEYDITLKNHLDAGKMMYKENDISGSSGPVTLPLILFSNILKNKKYKKILLLATGALHSKTLIDQKETIPSITHAISLEVLN